jgi:predicted transcriptional regulator
MAKVPDREELGARERQILDAVYRLGEASVGDVLAELPDPPSYSAVRTMVRHLEAKGLLKHRQEGVKYIYRPSRPASTARMQAIEHLKRTFFGGSAADAAAAILDPASAELSDAELERLEQLIRDARRGGK